MKKLMYLMLLGLVASFLVTSCTVEDVNELPNSVQEEESLDELQSRISPQPALPDLVIRNVRSNLVVGNTACPGGNQADGTCNSGATFVQLTATLRNITAVSIPSGTDIIVKWEEYGEQPIFSILSGGLAGNSSKTINSPVYPLACPTGLPPFQLETRIFYAEADPNDAINEFRENNNVSVRYNVCDDI